jgi:hypothetical protein
MKAINRRLLVLLLGLFGVSLCCVRADTIYYTLENVMLSETQQMTGLFSWTYTPGDFENGTGQFLALGIPWTDHDQDDLNATFDIGSSIEITLEGSVHDDGVDIALILTNAPTSTTSAELDLSRSKYEIGGNGFHDGTVFSGSIVPVQITLSMTVDTSGLTWVSWPPEVPGLVLQENPDLLSTNWVDSASGTTNPAELPITAPAMFYRLVEPSL